MGKLSDQINYVRRKASVFLNLAKNPAPMLRQWLVLKGKRVINEAPGLPVRRGSQEDDKAVNDLANGTAIASPTQVRPSNQTPISLARLPAAIAPPTSEDINEIFSPDELYAGIDYPPILFPNTSVQGEWGGGYIIGECAEDRGWIRRYEAVQTNNDEPVWIYEYCLSENEDVEDRKKRFRDLVYRNARLGDGSDFRILKPKDVFCSGKEQRTCYMATQALTEGQLLAAHVSDPSTQASAQQVRSLFRQVLQTLQYLRTYRVTWPDERPEMAVGLPHGNLGIDSIWLRFSQIATAAGERPFFAYVSRFSLWEQLFAQEPPGHYVRQQPAESTQRLGSLAGDFADLGNAGFAWITGHLQPGDPTDSNAVATR